MSLSSSQLSLRLPQVLAGELILSYVGLSLERRLHIDWQIHDAAVYVRMLLSTFPVVVVRVEFVAATSVGVSGAGLVHASIPNASLASEWFVCRWLVTQSGSIEVLRVHKGLSSIDRWNSAWVLRVHQDATALVEPKVWSRLEVAGRP